MNKFIKLNAPHHPEEPSKSFYIVSLEDVFAIRQGYYEWDKFVFVKGINGGLEVDKESFDKVVDYLRSKVEEL